MIYEIAGINPEPWSSPSGTVVPVAGSSGSRRKLRVQMSSAPALVAYKAALADAFRAAYPNVRLYRDTPIQLDLFFWRRLEQYQNDDGRSVTKNYADATNMQKAAEDALQGVLYGNDRINRIVRSEIMEATTTTQPFIVIKITAAPSPTPWAVERYRQHLDREAGRVLLDTPPPGRDTTGWF